MKLFFNLAAPMSLCIGLLAAFSTSAEVAYLAFSENDSHWQVWTMKNDGSDQRQLTTSPHDKSSISWYPNGRSVLVNGAQGDLAKVDVETGKEESLKLSFHEFADASLSYDGKKIAFSFNAADSSDDNNIWIMNIDGSNAQKMTDMVGLQHEPRWNRDNSALYFVSTLGQQVNDIWRVDIVSRDKEQLTVGQLYNFEAHPAPDGKLYFSSNRSGNYEIWMKDTEGKDHRLTTDPAFDSSPVLSANKKNFIFESARAGRTNLWSMNLQTKEATQLTQHQMGARKPVVFYGAGE